MRRASDRRSCSRRFLRARDRRSADSPSGRGRRRCALGARSGASSRHARGAPTAPRSHRASLPLPSSNSAPGLCASQRCSRRVARGRRGNTRRRRRGRCADERAGRSDAARLRASARRDSGRDSGDRRCDTSRSTRRSRRSRDPRAGLPSATRALAIVVAAALPRLVVAEPRTHFVTCPIRPITLVAARLFVVNVVCSPPSDYSPPCTRRNADGRVMCGNAL